MAQVLSLQNVVFLECRKGCFGSRTGQKVNLGSKTQPQPKCLQKRSSHRLGSIRQNANFHVATLPLHAGVSRECPTGVLEIGVSDGVSKDQVGGVCPWHTYRSSQNDCPRKIILVSHYSAIGDAVSCDPPCSAIGFRGMVFLRYPSSKVCLGLR